MTIQDLTQFHISQGWLNPSLPVDVPLTEELDAMAEKLQRQIQLNASLICEVKRLETKVKELERRLQQVEVL